MDLRYEIRSRIYVVEIPREAIFVRYFLPEERRNGGRGKLVGIFRTEEEFQEEFLKLYPGVVYYLEPEMESHIVFPLKDGEVFASLPEDEKTWPTREHWVVKFRNLMQWFDDLLDL